MFSMQDPGARTRYQDQTELHGGVNVGQCSGAGDQLSHQCQVLPIRPPVLPDSHWSVNYSQKSWSNFR